MASQVLLISNSTVNCVINCVVVRIIYTVKKGESMSHQMWCDKAVFTVPPYLVANHTGLITTNHKAPIQK